MKRKALCIFLIIIIVASGMIPVVAHGRKEHDEQLELVLFGNSKYSTQHPEVKDKIQALEDAVYLYVDQFQGNGVDCLSYLQNRSVSHLPQTISEIDFPSNYEHRKYTHLGFDFDYSDGKVVDYPNDWPERWEKRKNILIYTVEKELFSEVKSIFIIQWIKDLFNNRHYDEKRNSFCALVYYVHIISDNEEAKNIVALKNTYKLTRFNDHNIEPYDTGPGIIAELIDHFKILFQDQVGSYKYMGLISELSVLKTRCDRIANSTGLIYTDDGFQEYHECVIDLLNCLSRYVPYMLMEEDYFAAAFSK